MLSLVEPSKLKGEAPRISAVTVRVSVVAFPSVVLPSVEKLPSTSSVFLIVVVPVEAAIVRAVASPAKLTVAAVAFIRLKVVAVVVKSPPLTAKSPVIVKFPVLVESARVSRVLVPSEMVRVPASPIVIVGEVSRKLISRSQLAPILIADSVALDAVIPSMSRAIKLSPEVPLTGSKLRWIAETALLVPSPPSILT